MRVRVATSLAFSVSLVVLTLLASLLLAKVVPHGLQMHPSWLLAVDVPLLLASVSQYDLLLHAGSRTHARVNHAVCCCCGLAYTLGAMLQDDLYPWAFHTLAFGGMSLVAVHAAGLLALA